MVNKLTLLVSFSLLIYLGFYNEKSYGQCLKDSLNDEIVFAVEAMPYFKGGEGEFIKFRKTNLKYPETALKDSTEGTVFVCFWVDTLGKTFDHWVVKGIRNDLDEEALRVAKLIQFETPAFQRGKPVCVEYIVPFTFEIKPKRKKTRPTYYKPFQRRLFRQSYYDIGLSLPAIPLGETKKDICE